MNVNVLFFASLRDKVGFDSLTLDLAGNSSKADLFVALQELIGKTRVNLLQEADVSIAVNQTLKREEFELNPGDEVAFLPPITGG